MWLLQLKPQTGLVQVLGSQFKGHPVVEVVIRFTLHHTAALDLHHPSVYL